MAPRIVIVSIRSDDKFPEDEVERKNKQVKWYKPTEHKLTEKQMKILLNDAKWNNWLRRIKKSVGEVTRKDCQKCPSLNGPKRKTYCGEDEMGAQWDIKHVKVVDVATRTVAVHWKATTSPKPAVEEVEEDTAIFPEGHPCLEYQKTGVVFKQNPYPGVNLESYDFGYDD